MTPQRLAVFSLVTLTFIAPVFADQSVGWRGDATGRYPNASPPLQWSDTENVVWKTELPGRSYGSPVVVDELIFVVSDPAELICIHASGGKILWQRSITAADALGKEAAEKILSEWNGLSAQKKQLQDEYRDLRKAKPDAKEEHDALKEKVKAVDEQIKQMTRTNPVPNDRGSGNSAATPICDGNHVYAVFGNGIVAAFDLEGKKKWTKFVEGAVIGFGHSSSPLLLDGKLIVHFQDLVGAKRRERRRNLWRAELPARHASSIAVTLGDTSAIVSPAGNIVRTSDGKVLVSEQALRVSEGSPIVDARVVYAQGGKSSAFRLPSTAGDEIELELIWEASSSRGRRTPSSVIHEGLLYGVTTNGILEVTDTKTGKSVFRKRLDMGNIYSSVTVAGQHIFITNTKGETVVLAAGREYNEAARNKLESLGSNPVFIGKRMYVRSHKHLYCIGQ